MLKAMRLSLEIKDTELTKKFIEHLMMNLERLIKVRLLLYGLYITAISTLMTLYFTINPTGAGPKGLFIIGSLVGELIVVMQIIISIQIQSSYATLDLIFNNIIIVNEINEIANDIKSKRLAVLMKHPYAFALVLIHAANAYLFWKAKEVISSNIYCSWVLLLVLFAFPILYYWYAWWYKCKYFEKIAPKLEVPDC